MSVDVAEQNLDMISKVWTMAPGCIHNLTVTSLSKTVSINMLQVVTTDFATWLWGFASPSATRAALMFGDGAFCHITIHLQRRGWGLCAGRTSY